MKDLALRALDAVARRGVTYADVRAVDSREREISTKNGKAGHVSSSESQGIGIRVLDHGCWGFAATDDLTAEGIEAAAALALEIARACTTARTHEVALAPEEKYDAVWVSPFRIDPFSVSDRSQSCTLLPADSDLRRKPESRSPKPRCISRARARSSSLPSAASSTRRAPDRRGIRRAQLQGR